MRGRRVFLCFLVLAMSLVSVVFGGPEARMGPGLVYDEVNGMLVLVGGAWDTGYGWSNYGDMWVFEDNVWSELVVSGVPSSNNFEMGYSVDQEVIVVFTNNNDYTYVYDVAGEHWSLSRQADGPIRRGDAGFCYDPVNRVFVMYGGLTDDNVEERVLGDTWVYDVGSDAWTEMNPVVSPPNTYGCRLVWDSVNEVMLLWGGNLPWDNGGKLDDWWRYDYQSNTWTMIDTEDKPPMRYWQYMAFDEASGKIVMFGGNPSGLNFGDTWLYDYAENTWTEVHPEVSPSPRQCGALVYYPSLGGVVMFGGIDEDQSGFDDTWVFDAVTGEWSLVEEGVPVEVDGGNEVRRIPGFPVVSVLMGFMVFVLMSLGYTRLDRTVFS